MLQQITNNGIGKSSFRKSVKVSGKKKITKQINRVQLLNFMLKQKGKIVSINYLKLDGTERKLTGRLGVKKYLHGGRNNVEAIERSYLVMFDMKICEYRTVDLESAIQIRAQGCIWNVID